MYVLNFVLLDIINKYEILWLQVFVLLDFASRKSHKYIRTIIIDYPLLLSIIIDGIRAVSKPIRHKYK